MHYFIRLLILLVLILSLSNCTEKISYSGKILNENNIDYKSLKKMEQVINVIGQPNYIDPIENKYYYFTEQKSITNFFDQKITNRNIVIFKFDNNNNVIEFDQYDLENEQDIEYIKEKTPNNVIKRGLLEKIFGGVTTNKIQ